MLYLQFYNNHIFLFKNYKEWIYSLELFCAISGLFGISRGIHGDQG